MWWPAVVNSEFSLRLDNGRSPHAYVNQRLQIQLELLMMSGVPLETCWDFSERWNNKFYYKVASCWLFLLSHTTMHGSINIKFVLFYVLFVCKCVLPPGDNPIAYNPRPQKIELQQICALDGPARYGVQWHQQPPPATTKKPTRKNTGVFRNFFHYDGLRETYGKLWPLTRDPSRSRQ